MFSLFSIAIVSSIALDGEPLPQNDMCLLGLRTFTQLAYLGTSNRYYLPNFCRLLHE